MGRPKRYLVSGLFGCAACEASFPLSNGGRYQAQSSTLTFSALFTVLTPWVARAIEIASMDMIRTNGTAPVFQFGTVSKS